MADRKATTNVFQLASPAEVAKVISFLLPVFAGLSMTGHLNWLTAINAAVGIIGAVAILHSSANPYIKGLVAIATAGLQALAVYVSGETGLAGVSTQDWWTVIGAALGAVGVVYVPNATNATPGALPDPADDFQTTSGAQQFSFTANSSRVPEDFAAAAVARFDLQQPKHSA
jgi:hypothetical protein